MLVSTTTDGTILTLEGETTLMIGMNTVLLTFVNMVVRENANIPTEVGPQLRNPTWPLRLCMLTTSLFTNER